MSAYNSGHQQIAEKVEVAGILGSAQTDCQIFSMFDNCRSVAGNYRRLFKESMIARATSSLLPETALRTVPSRPIISTLFSLELMALASLLTIISHSLRCIFTIARKRPVFLFPAQTRRPIDEAVVLSSRGHDVGVSMSSSCKGHRTCNLLRTDTHRHVITGCGGADQTIHCGKQLQDGVEHIAGRSNPRHLGLADIRSRLEPLITKTS